MTTWGFIGSGNIGSTVARLAIAAGHDAVLSNSRGPETLADLVGELGPHARAATAQEAASAGDIVVVTIPLKAYRDIPVDELAGKIVIDTMNYYPRRDGQLAAIDDGSTTSSELLQAHLPQSHVVKGFNNIFFQHLRDLARPAGSDERSALPIAGDDAAAKDTVRRALDALGYDTLDLGPLAEGWRTQPGQPAYGTLYAVDEADWAAGARPAGSDEVAGLAMRATRQV
jgi:hypothetical protein